MIVSWNWLKQYVALDMPVEELERRLMMAGLNHESTGEVGGDLAIDLEVTSNRPDCLGHLGIAREISVLWQHPLAMPKAEPAEGPESVDKLVRVRIECPELCSRYTARVIRGVKVGPSPAWMVRRLETVGLAAINNIVDISNYVLMECGQPLHTFDYDKLQGAEIIVRQPRSGEQIEAIDHKTYRLEPGMCVIADARSPVAIGGVMGGAGTEVSSATRAVLVEAAEFDPIAIRTTARRLNLHSDSSYRFERRVDPEGIDWASRRCCELILELAGGELAAGVAEAGPNPGPRPPVVLRFAQLKRILGIDVPADRVRQILTALGNRETAIAADSVTVVPPSWRRDLTREIDLIEEVARIDGYDKIPEDVSVPMAPSARRPEDRVLERVRHVLTAAGMDEAMTLSLVDESTAGAVRFWTEGPPLRSQMAVLRGADCLRVSLVPSLLAARRTNETLANDRIELFEVAKIYLPQGKKLPREEPMLGLSSGRSWIELKGVIEAVVAALNPEIVLEADPLDLPPLDPQNACRLRIGDQTLGYLGLIQGEGLKTFDLRGPTTVAEIKVELLLRHAKLVPQYVPQPLLPATTRDLNLVVDEAVRWADLSAVVRRHGGPWLESVEYRDTYRDPERLPPGKKSLLLTIALRSREGTLTNQQADEVRQQIVEACAEAYGAELR